MNMKHYLLAGMVAAASPAFADRPDHPASKLDQQTVDVTMEVALYAEITKLDDLQLKLSKGKDGDKNSQYAGKDEFTVETNGPVRITVNGSDMQSEKDGSSVETRYSIDGKESATINSRDKQAFDLEALATLDEISSQSYGDYEGEVTITVSAASIGGGDRDRD